MIANLTPMMVVAFVTVASLILLISLLVSGRDSRAEERVRDLTEPEGRRGEMLARVTQTTLPKIGKPLVPADEKERSRLKARMIHAGFYRPHAMYVFLGLKVILATVPPALGIIVGLVGLVPLAYALIGGMLAGSIGLVAPSFFLNWRKSKRQRNFRRSLPDALDIIVICVEAGLSLEGAFRRVSEELGSAHPLLASELRIVEREIELGRTASQALRHFAERSDLDEIRGLASVILQTERFGASMVNALRIHADTLRLQRHQAAEAMAHTAGTKMLFPTLLFIFPAMFVVILGPAAIQIKAALVNMQLTK
jgi:tight adherence protein C